MPDQSRARSRKRLKNFRVDIVFASADPHDRNRLNPYGGLCPERRREILVQRLAKVWGRICLDQVRKAQAEGSTPGMGLRAASRPVGRSLRPRKKSQITSEAMESGESFQAM
jgi:hypothetical protein